MTGVPQSPSPSPPPGPLTPSRVSANRDQSSPPRIQSAHLPLFDRLRTARDIAEAQHLCRGQSLRQQDQERQEQKDLQKKIREVEVRAMQEVINLRQSLAAAQLDAQEQRRANTTLREQVERDAKLVRTPQAQQAAVDAAVRDAAEQHEAALERVREENRTAVAEAVEAARREAAVEADARVAEACERVDDLSHGNDALRREMLQSRR